ncbi:hypothetical protein ACQWU4_08355 [Chryseobacterium sp. MIQD13]|uniref:hypothetical protein n=1 Tax=Chryseobacterium sp. MIQD13 TaxID=3422310 RepID=UPI003D2818C7
MKNYIYLIILFNAFQACTAQNKANTEFIYHTADYDLGTIYDERIYNSSTGIYEYKKYANDSLIQNIKLYIKFSQEDLESIYKLYLSSKSEMSDCYFENNIIVHKSALIFNSKKDNFNEIKCIKNGDNSIFTKIENKIEKNITSSSIYKTTFSSEFYKK